MSSHTENYVVMFLSNINFTVLQAVQHQKNALQACSSIENNVTFFSYALGNEIFVLHSIYINKNIDIYFSKDLRKFCTYCVAFHYARVIIYKLWTSLHPPHPAICSSLPGGAFLIFLRHQSCDISLKNPLTNLSYYGSPLPPGALFYINESIKFCLYKIFNLRKLSADWLSIHR